MASSDDVIEAIYAASLDPVKWRDVVEEIGALFNTATGTFYVDRAASQGVGADMVASFGHGTKAVTSYNEYFAAVNPFDRNLDRFAVGEVVTDTVLDRRLQVAGAFESSEYYNDWVRPQHLRHVLGGYVERFDAGTLVAAFWRAGDAGAYDRKEIASFGRLMRHATRSIAVGDRLRTIEAEMEAMLNRSSSAVFTIGRDGAVRQSNAAGDALLRAGSALRRSGKRLRTAVAGDQAALDRLVACAFEPRLATWAENVVVPIRRTDGKPALTARAIAVAQRFGPFVPDRMASAIVTVDGFEIADDRLAERLRRRFGLTPAQTRLALALRSGKTLSEAAAALGIKFETARAHLKALFARTGTHRQAELVLLLRDLEAR